MGSSCAGKSTLAAELAHRLGLEFIELDALYWRPRWESPSDEEFARTLREATAGHGWIVAGNYIRHTVPLYWEHLDTVIWLDFPNRTMVPRIITRSWRRWRKNELLWGTNYERFWVQFKLWDTKESLIAYNLRHRGRLRSRMLAAMAAPELGHLHWVRLSSPAEVRRWLERLEAEDAGR